ncbi:MAG: Fe-S cluster assembly protein SufD [Gemmatirosa sp.]|nr:Fe-S cluster assembly protein SufD [Gemmatirosa sp.]
MTATHPETQSLAQAIAADAQRDASVAPGQFLPPPQAILDELGDALAGAELGEPRWLFERRRDAGQRFAATGFPTPKHEDWHYTSTAPIAEAGFATLRDAAGALGAEDLAPYTFGQSAWPTVVCVNGRFDAARSSLGTLPDGVRVLPLTRALAEQPDLVERYLGRVAATAEQPFTALNTALFQDGIAILVGKEMEAEVPVHVLWISDAVAARGTTHPRTLIVAERHSKATVIESYVGLGEASYFTNAVTEADLADGATVHHLRLQRESPRAFHVGTVEARQGRDSHWVSFSLAAGAKLSRTNVFAALDGEGCGATLNGLYMLDEDQHGDHQTRIEHAQPNTYSRELYKGILDGASHGVFNGKVYVHPVAQKTDGKQTNNTLLLSDRARIDAKPQLEIFADDVKCTHGATIGRLDETALFYMKSRGLNAETAKRLLTYAFAADVIETIEIAAVRDALEALTLQRYV